MAAVTGAVAAAAKPRARRTGQPRAVPDVPAQRTTGIEALGLGVEDLEESAHDEQDARLVEALEWPGR